MAQLVAQHFHGSYPALVASCVRQGFLTLAEVATVLQAAESPAAAPPPAPTNQPFS